MKKTPLQYALDLIAMRDRSVAEIRKKMREKEIDSKIVEDVIQNLIDKKFLDDERFVKNYISSQKRQGRYGKFRIVQKLIRFGIGQELIDNIKSELDGKSEYDRAEELAEKWLQRNLQKDKLYEKLGRFLAGRGFEIDIVKEILGKVLK